MSLSDEVLNIVKKIPRGKVTTYGAIAKALDTSPRAVGQALHSNEHPIVIPCHRVVMSDGRVGGYAGGVKKKIELLESEGVKVRNGMVIERYILNSISSSLNPAIL